MNGLSGQDVARERLEQVTEMLSEMTALSISQARAINRQAEFINELVSEQTVERIPPRPAGRAQVRVMRQAG